MVRSEALKKAQKKYQKEKVVMRTIKFYKNTDEKLIDHIESIENFTKYIKDLIEKDIKESDK